MALGRGKRTSVSDLHALAKLVTTPGGETPSNSLTEMEIRKAETRAKREAQGLPTSLTVGEQLRGKGFFSS